MQTKPKIQIDLAKVEECAQFCDNDEEIARALGISPSTLYNRKRESAEFKEAIKNGRAKANVFVGGKLMEQVKKGNITAIIFYLKCRAGWKDNIPQEANAAPAVQINITDDLDPND